MSMLSDLRMYGRFVFGLPGFLRRRITLEEARAAVRRGLAEREDNFLRLLRRGIFDYPRSPYLPLLRLAQCEFGDIEAQVRRIGLEPTLAGLRDAGVYFSFEEYKGSQPVVRHGEHIELDPRDFANPVTARAYATETGGTTSGQAARVNTDLDNLWSTVPHLMLVRQIHGALDVPFGLWRGVLPDPTGVGNVLRAVPYGGTPERWFSPVVGGGFRPSFKNRMANAYIVRMSRLCGAPCPWPEPTPLDQAGVVARWAAETAAHHGGAFLSASVSLSVRVCVAALEEGLDLSGVVFLAGGEPATSSRRATIERAGARMAPVYISSDMGPLGLGCATPAEANDQHLLEDCVALIQHPREIPGAETEVDVFYFTSLRPAAATILLNVESDDYGVVEDRACGCPFEELGYHRHMRGIRSYGKLTGEGVTLVGSDMTKILEESLPQRFGGSPLDYQLVEEENEQGLGRLVLLVSPKVDIPGEQQVIDAVLEELGHGSEAAGIARIFWKQANTLRVRRQEPGWTSRGKLSGLQLSRGAGRRTAEPSGERATASAGELERKVGA
jgi:hypothetical protein